MVSIASHAVVLLLLVNEITAADINEPITPEVLRRQNQLQLVKTTHLNEGVIAIRSHCAMKQTKMKDMKQAMGEISDQQDAAEVDKLLADAFENLRKVAGEDGFAAIAAKAHQQAESTVNPPYDSMLATSAWTKTDKADTDAQPLTAKCTEAYEKLRAIQAKRNAAIIFASTSTSSNELIAILNAKKAEAEKATKNAREEMEKLDAALKAADTEKIQKELRKAPDSLIEAVETGKDVKDLETNIKEKIPSADPGLASAVSDAHAAGEDANKAGKDLSGKMNEAFAKLIELDMTETQTQRDQAISAVEAGDTSGAQLAAQAATDKEKETHEALTHMEQTEKDKKAADPTVNDPAYDRLHNQAVANNKAASEAAKTARDVAEGRVKPNDVKKGGKSPNSDNNGRKPPGGGEIGTPDINKGSKGGQNAGDTGGGADRIGWSTFGAGLFGILVLAAIFRTA